LQEINLIKKKKHKLTINDITISNKDEFWKLIDNLEPWLNKNDKIHLKLKINIDEYLIISNILYPTLVK
jgi:TFIIF-interacting CTD phosphatase-like protein